MQTAIDEWLDMYRYHESSPNDDRSLDLPSAVSSEFARLVTAESEIIIEGSKRADFLNEQLRQQFSEDFNKAALKLKEKERQLKDFLDQTGQLPDNARTQVLGFGRSQAQKAVWAEKKSPLSLTNFLNNGTITDKEAEFRKGLKLGRFNTQIESSKQQNHVSGKQWKNQVKQAIKSNGKQTPKSILNKNIDPQEIVNKYGGTGRIVISGDGKTVNEFVTLSETIGKTYDNKTGKFISTKTVQIKYTEKGVHIFPTKELIK